MTNRNPSFTREATFKCDVCGVVGVGAYAPIGWWQYPPGWFVFETEHDSGLACCAEHAAAFDRRDGTSSGPTGPGGVGSRERKEREP